MVVFKVWEIGESHKPIKNNIIMHKYIQLSNLFSFNKLLKYLSIEIIERI